MVFAAANSSCVTFLKVGKPGAEKSRLQSLISRWSARNLDSERLRNDSVNLLHLTRSYFLPILDIWYPSAVTNFAGVSAVNAVLDADITTSVPDMANMVNAALAGLYTEFGNASRGQKLPAEEGTECEHDQQRRATRW